MVQNGNTISGTLLVTGLPSCFDPVADKLTVSGTFSGTDTSVSFSSASIRGQVLNFSGKEDVQLVPCPGCVITPPSPVKVLDGNITITGGACAGTALSSGAMTDFSGTTAIPAGAGDLMFQLSQAGPDAQGVFNVSGTFSATGTPCFTSGSVSTSTIAGELTQITATMDTGQLTGSGQIVGYLDTSANFKVEHFYLLTMHGGPCDGQIFTTVD